MSWPLRDCNADDASHRVRTAPPSLEVLLNGLGTVWPTPALGEAPLVARPDESALRVLLLDNAAHEVRVIHEDDGCDSTGIRIEIENISAFERHV